MDKVDDREKNAPMLLNDEKKPPPTISTANTIKEIAAYARWPILGMIFHPVYSIVNAAVVGRFADEKYLAALGLGSLTTGIMLISICSCFCLVLGTFVAPAYGDERPDLCKRYLFRQLVLNAIVYAITIIPLFWIEDIYLAIG